MNPGSPDIPASVTATTKGEADAPVDCLVANERAGELYGTNMPIRRTESM